MGSVCRLVNLSYTLSVLQRRQRQNVMFTDRSGRSQTNRTFRKAWPWALGCLAGLALLSSVAALPDKHPPVEVCPQTSIEIHKAAGVVDLFCAGTLRGTFQATFGQHPVGPKQQEGDERTPEGRYQISSRIETTRFHRFLGISYPNAEDLARARALHIARPGGGIGIHGVKQSLAGWARLWLRTGHTLGLNRLWGPTDGCIGVSNEDIETLYAAARVGTPVLITP